MRGVNDFGALNWVKSELDETIGRARQALEVYIESEGDEGAIGLCADHLHQVAGVLQMVQIYGPGMLAEEMEAVARAMANGQVPQQDDAAEALILSLIQLPDYLERLQAGDADVPLIILPLLNDLRAAREAPLLSEAALFKPEIAKASVLGRVTGEPNPEISSLVRRLRQKFHVGLLSWYRNQNVEEGWQYLREVFDELAQHAGTHEVYSLAWVAGALTRGLIEHSIISGIAVKQLFSKIDRQLKSIIDGGEGALDRDQVDDLLKNLLYYIAQAITDDSRINEVKKAYDLEAVMPSEVMLKKGRQGLSGSNAELAASISEAIQSELTRVKDVLDLFMRNQQAETDMLAQLENPIRKLADTLGMIGQGALRSRLLHQAEKVKSFIGRSEPPEEYELMEMAGDILYVESSLSTLHTIQSSEDEEITPEEGWGLNLPEGEYRSLLKQTVREAKVDIAKAKEAIIDYTETPGEPQVLTDVYDAFMRVYGALKLLELADSAQILQRTAEFIKTRMINGNEVPFRQQFNSLADVISSIEYFLEALVDGAGDRREIIAIAQSALHGLLSSKPEAADKVVSAEIISLADYPVNSEEGLPEVDRAEKPEAGEISELTTEEASVDLFEVPIPSSEKPALEDIDAEILEIFVEEAREELETIQQDLPAWQKNPDDKDILISFRRSFHTLKGSGRLVGAKVIGELAWSMENMLNRVIDETIKAGPEIMVLLDDVLRLLPVLIDCQEQAVVPEVDVDSVMQRAFALANGQVDTNVVPVEGGERQSEQEIMLESPRKVEASDTNESAAHESMEASGINSTDRGMSDGVTEQGDLQVDSSLRDTDDKSDHQGFSDSDLLIEIDTELLEVFVAESESHVEELETFISQVKSSDPRLRIPDEVIRACHTLHGSARMTGITPIANLSRSVEVYLKTLVEKGRVADEDVITLLKDSIAYIRKFLAWLPNEQLPEPNADSCLIRLAAAQGELLSEHLEYQSQETAEADHPASESRTETVSAEPVSDLLAREDEVFETSELMGSEPLTDEAAEEPATPFYAEPQSFLDDDLFPVTEDPELLEVFIEEAKEQLETLESCYQGWVSDVGDTQHITEIQRTLHTLKGSARLAGVLPVGDLSHAVESLFNGLMDGCAEISDAVLHAIRKALDILATQIDETESVGQLHRADSLIQHMESLLKKAVENDHLSPQSLVEESELLELDTDELTQGSVSEWHNESESFPQDSALVEVDEDPELLEVFIEEAREFIEHLESGFQRWAGNPDDHALIDDMQRSLHTLKGSARLAGVNPVGDLSHAVESLLTGVSDAKVVVTNHLLDVVRQALDKLAAQIDEISNMGKVSRATDLMVKLGDTLQPVQETIRTDNSEKEGGNTEGQAESAVVLPFVSEFAKKAKLKKEKTAAPFKSSKDKVRVSAELMDRLVNNAGEVSIYRARLEQQNSVLGFNLSELKRTVSRLFTQLRNLEIETEAQILFRWEGDNERDERDKTDFDPLELDRFSNMQQLSRALVETVNDLGSINESLTDLQRDTDTLLLQQSRISTDLQDGLLRTRMVPFTQMVPRMQRLVRQTADHLGKKAQLECIGSEGELDRNILNRLVPVLEHLLRNAVSHGIGLPEERQASGKDKTGKISIYIDREATDILITLSDDGKGLDIGAIRAQAIELGMIDESTVVSNDDLIQCVLNPGFSTAKEVTQISGRGVGLDVVASEVKQLGGGLDIDSQSGRGTSFTIRLPLTLAVTDALLVRMGDEVYAIPHGSVEGVVRIRHKELQACYADEQQTYTYANNNYKTANLGRMMSIERNELSESMKWYPLLLVHAGEHHVALQVDELLGTRQIVVKSVGQQVGSVRWITGGTILADGRVALILDLGALVRMDAARLPSGSPPMEIVASKNTQERIRVMVVDDSITVRKVTSRLLERHNMDVVTAKDGVDAVALLQEHSPDIMLLDIEMPRMDGFELARHINNSVDYYGLPIIMISSRVGDKHRQRAFDLGVKRCLGKPYQELELMDTINEVLAEVQA
jgi:chemosensory pili system protein ChpA (sensor histidine kinase/response regulator)